MKKNGTKNGSAGTRAKSAELAKLKASKRLIAAQLRSLARRNRNGFAFLMEL